MPHMPHIASPRRVMIVGGRELDLTAKQVVDAMRDVEPEPIRDHLVEIVNREFPPKQVLATITGWDRQSFTTMEANRVLARLGFHCCRIGRRPDDVDQADPSPIDRRISAVEAALAVAQEAIAGLVKRVAELEQANR
jgi:hypothetical protein